MSSPYLKVGFVCALFATMIGLAFYTFMPAEPANDYHYNGLSQDVIPPPPPPAPMTPPPPPVHQETTGDEVFKVVERMPMFPGCDYVSNYEERRTCANKRLLEYVYDAINYPEEAVKKGVEGTAVVGFKVSTTGKIFDERLMRNPGAGTGEEALRVVKAMRESGMRWTPGSSSGRQVTVQFNLPVKFKLD